MTDRIATRHQLSRRSFLAVSLMGAALAGTPVRHALAQDASPTAEAAPAAPEFAIHPLDETANGYPELELAPGASAGLAIGVTVSGTIPVDLTVFRADTIPIVNGGFAAAELEDTPTGQTLWLDLEPTAVSGEPGQTVEMTVPVTVAPDATPGQYVTALVAQTGPLAITGTEMFNQVLRNALPVMITVPGEVTPGMEVGEPSIVTEAGVRFIEIAVANTGNILIRPTGSVTLTTAGGDEVIAAPVSMQSIYLGLESAIRVAVPEQVAPGEYRISYELTEPTYGLQAAMVDVPVTLAAPVAAGTPESATFTVDPVTVTPSGDPIQFAEVTATIVNNGPAIPTARVSLVALRDGTEVETYALANNQALPQGESTVTQRYLPATGWQPGAWTFRVVVTGVDASGTETALAEVEVPGEIVVP